MVIVIDAAVVEFPPSLRNQPNAHPKTLSKLTIKKIRLVIREVTRRKAVVAVAE
jgi:hypothetical protein